MMSQLLEEILSQDNMILAYKKVKANRGTSGIDGIGVDEIDEYLRENWETIRDKIHRRNKWRGTKSRDPDSGRPNH